MAVPVGMWVILGIGLVALLVAALGDRRSRLHAEAEMAALPSGRRLARMSQNLCTHLDALLEAEHLTIPARLADPRAASHLSPEDVPTAVLEHARVITCPEPLDGARLIQAILMGDPDQGGLAIVTPALDEFALGVVLANHLHGSRAVVPVIATPEECAQITQALSSTATTTAGIRSGWLPAEVWAHAELVVSDAISTTLLPSSPGTTSPGVSTTT